MFYIRLHSLHPIIGKMSYSNQRQLSKTIPFFQLAKLNFRTLSIATSCSNAPIMNQPTPTILKSRPKDKTLNSKCVGRLCRRQVSLKQGCHIVLNSLSSRPSCLLVDDTEVILILLSTWSSFAVDSESLLESHQFPVIVDFPFEVESW